MPAWRHGPGAATATGAPTPATGGASPSALLSGRLVVRLIATTSVLIVATCLVLSIVLVRRHLDEIRQGLVDRGREIGAFVAREAELGALSGNVSALRQLGLIALSQRDVVYCRFFDRQGTLLASIGERAGAAVAPPPSQSASIAPVDVTPDVWEFHAPITTTARRRRREELLGDPTDDVAGSAREQIGSVAIGIVLTRLHEDRYVAVVTAMTFTLLVALLAVVSARILMKGTFRALASAAELAEERSRLAELKAGFVTQASHEFRTPLAVILACCSALQRYGARMTVDQQRRRLSKIHGSVRHMTELIEDVLTLGRSESGKLICAPKPADVETLCREVVADARAAASDVHEIILQVARSVGVRMIDAKLVRQILRNLLTNALKYSPSGTTVWLGVTAGGATVTFRVTDEGIGIPAGDRDAIFEPFHRGANVGKAPGSGLGLAITQKAVTLHGGTIGVAGVPDGGTTFTVTLPADVARTAAPAAS